MSDMAVLIGRATQPPDLSRPWYWVVTGGPNEGRCGWELTEKDAEQAARGAWDG